MDRDGKPSMLWLSPNRRTKALRNEDTASNDEDALGLALREKLMQAASRLGEILDEGGSYKLATSFCEGDPSPKSFDLKNGTGADCAVKEKILCVASKSSQNGTRRLTPIQDYSQEESFRGMGSLPALIQRAISMHGIQADKSFKSHGNDFLGVHTKKQADHRGVLLPIKEIETTVAESDSGRLTRCQQLANSTRGDEAEQHWDSDDCYSSDSLDVNGEGATPCKPGSPTDWTDGWVSDYPVLFCEGELPTAQSHRHLMSSHGFAAELVERAMQELGKGVDYEILLEYLLHQTAQQDPTALTAGSCLKRASTPEMSVRECTYPNKKNTSYEKRITTVEKLVEECGYPAKAVEEAVILCGKSLWNAEGDEINHLVDFLETCGAGLCESEVKTSDDLQEDADWPWLRQHLKEDTSGGSKRELGCEGAARRKRVVRLRPRFNLKLHDQSPVSFPLSPKGEHSNQPSLKRKQSSSPMTRVLLLPAQRRHTYVGRTGRPRMLDKEEVSITVDKHRGSVGFGLPGKPVQPRFLDEDIQGAPFFYFENVASMPNDEWDRIRRHLFDIEPEFVDSMHFSACRRPRGYIHNLPIDGRRKILVDPPMTIQELLPHTKPFWPAWDPRTKLNCVTTRMGSEFLIKKLHIGEEIALRTADPSTEQQREILRLCRHWNLVWTSPNIPTPIDGTEIEAMLGFDAGHSRNILSNRSRYKALGNSFSVYTVAFHFSVLKPLYPKGIKVLSLFSGVGGVEVALHKVGIKLLVVVSVEIDDGTRRCLKAWWASSKQPGILNQSYHNIKDLGRSQIVELVSMYGGFDLIVGGTPCNNLSGSNLVTRVGLDGKRSTVFFEFSRVVTAVRDLTIMLQHKK